LFCCHDRSLYRSNFASDGIWFKGSKAARLQYGSKTYQDWTRPLLLCMW
jgi:hypothetical protein